MEKTYIVIEAVMQKDGSLKLKFHSMRESEAIEWKKESHWDTVLWHGPAVEFTDALLGLILRDNCTLRRK